MSIQTEIERLNEAKLQLKAAIEAKGVTVESTITLDGYPELVEDIPADPSGDATATANDILGGKTAYVKGEKITGAIPRYTVDRTIQTDDIRQDGVQFLKLVSDPVGTPGWCLQGEQAKMMMFTKLSNLGDATAEDVAAGKTFTSAAGLRVTGTAQVSPQPETVTVEVTGSAWTVTADGYQAVDSSTPSAYVEVPRGSLVMCGQDNNTAYGYVNGEADFVLNATVQKDGKDCSVAVFQANGSCFISWAM